MRQHLTGYRDKQTAAGYLGPAVSQSRRALAHDGGFQPAVVVSVRLSGDQVWHTWFTAVTATTSWSNTSCFTIADPLRGGSPRSRSSLLPPPPRPRAFAPSAPRSGASTTVCNVVPLRSTQWGTASAGVLAHVHAGLGPGGQIHRAGAHSMCPARTKFRRQLIGDGAWWGATFQKRLWCKTPARSCPRASKRPPAGTAMTVAVSPVAATCSNHETARAPPAMPPERSQVTLQWRQGLEGRLTERSPSRCSFHSRCARTRPSTTDHQLRPPARARALSNTCWHRRSPGSPLSPASASRGTRTVDEEAVIPQAQQHLDQPCYWMDLRSLGFGSKRG